jgi:2-phospho-L-lactate guanylyltransferase
MKYSALIPVKSLKAAKSRLAAHLTPEQRANLMLDMLHHVVSTLQESHEFTHISVVSADLRVLIQAQTWGARALLEERIGHNPALTAAAQHEIQAYPETAALLTISADLPYVSVNDIHEFIDLSYESSLVLAASQEGTGTNAILARPPLIVPYAFGTNSLAHFRANAERQHLRYALCTRPGLALDVDTINDVTLLHRQPATVGYLNPRYSHTQYL